MDFGDEHEGSDSQRRRKRYHRHTPRQIQQLEAMFKECPHPDENQRAQLSRELGLEPRQIKFWFQNRRTQMKAQHERADNCFLRAENDKIRCENIAMREALKNIICPTCGGPPVAEDYFDEQKLRMENARLKEELDRMSNMTSKFLGRPFTQLPPVAPLSGSSLDLSVGGMGSAAAAALGVGVGGPSLDLDLLSSSPAMAPFQLPAPVSDMERPMMAEIATRAMDELIRLAQAGDHVWAKSPAGDGRETLNVDTYDSIFSKPGSSFRAPDINVEGSRDAGHVFMSAVALVDVFMDSSKWLEFFPSIVSKARTIDILVNGMAGRSESLILDVRGAAHHVAGGADAGVQLPALLPADRAGALGRRRRLGRPAARRALRRAVTLPPPPLRLPHRRHGQRLLQGDLGGAHGDAREGPHQHPLPRTRAQWRRLRRAPVARRAAARVRALCLADDARRAPQRHGRSDGGREEEHDEAVAADGEQLLREPERVAPAPVDDAVGVGRGERARVHAPQHRPRPAQRRRAQRRHHHLAPRPLRPRLRLRPRRERPLPVGRPVARQSGPGGVAHPQRLESRELHLVAQGAEREPEQHADPAGELHGRVGVAGGVLADRHPGGERGDERRGPLQHPSAAVGLHHRPRRPARRRLHQRRRRAGRRAGRLRRHRRLPDPRQQPALLQAQRRVRRHRQRPHQHHRAADQGRPQLRPPLTRELVGAFNARIHALHLQLQQQLLHLKLLHPLSHSLSIHRQPINPSIHACMHRSQHRNTS